MPSEPQRHYAELLAEHYTWMFGVPFATKVEEQRELLVHLGAAPGTHGLAVDLGCGPGFQTVALADLGFADVLAVDTSEALLRELEAESGSRPIRTACTDMRAVASLVPAGAAELAICMGDTLPHLPSLADLAQVFTDVHATLQPGGRFLATFRDLSTTLEGLERFIPVQGDAERVMTCFLEYGPDKVTVHDLVHVRRGAQWELRKSCYDKLRLSPARVAQLLTDAGFTVERSEPAGRLWAVVASR